MAISTQLRSLFTKLTGYWIYRKKHLPIGADLATDLNRLKSVEWKLLIEVGGNIGQSIPWLAKISPSASIHSFEPLAEPFEQLNNVAAQFGGRVHTHRFALGAQRETSEIYLHQKATSMSSMVASAGEFTFKTERVEVETLDRICEQEGISEIDFLKIDVEGYELKVLEGAKKLLDEDRIKVIMSEVNLGRSFDRQTRLSDIMKILEPQGFMLFGLYNLWPDRINKVNLYGDAVFIHHRYAPNITPWTKR